MSSLAAKQIYLRVFSIWLLLIILIGGLVFLLGNRYLFDVLRIEQGNFYKNIDIFAEIIKNSFYGLAILGFIAYRQLLIQQRFLLFGYLAAQLLGAFLIVRILKMSLGCSRPLFSVDNGICIGFTWESAYHSFPSGHSADLIISAIFFSILLNGRWLGIIFFFGLALFVAVSRVLLSQHFPIDVLGGLMIGGISAFLVLYGLMLRFYNPFLQIECRKNQIKSIYHYPL